MGVSLQFEVPFDAGGQGLWNVEAEGEILRTSPRERGMTLGPGGRDAGLEWGSAGRAVWPLRTEDPRRAPAGTSVRKAFVVPGRGLARPTLSYRARGSAWLPR